jgi:hypothetical protein
MYQPIVLSYFKRQLKQYVKKHRDLKDAVIEVLTNFDKRQNVNLGGSIYKVRLKIKSLPKGKSKSFRLIVLVLETESFLVPITIYFKSDEESLSKKEINDHLQSVLFELRMR